MNESDVLRELSRRTGLPESAAEAVLHGLRDLIREGEVDPEVLARDGEPHLFAHPELNFAATNPEDPSLVEEVIAKARRHPLGLEFLLSGLLASVAIALGAHAFTVEAARARLRKEQANEPVETSAS